MAKFPKDPSLARVKEALEILGFQPVREGHHISMARENDDGSTTPLTLPNHRKLKGSTLRNILTQSGISRDEFLDAYTQAK